MTAFTILIISHGHEERLKKCLDSIHPNIENWQIVIVANGKPLSDSFKQRALVIDSDKLLTPGQARNLGTAYAEGKWIFFLSEDAYLGTHYWEVLLPLLDIPAIEVVGGPALPGKKMDTLSRALAISLTSPFCTGTTFPRYQSLGKKLVLADEEKLTVLNLWIKSDLVRQVRFAEEYLKGEEILLLQVLKAKGNGVYYHPKLVAFQASTGPMKDFFWEGYYRSRLMKRGLATEGQLFWLPTLFVLLHSLVLIWPEAFWSLGQLYGGVISFVSLGISMRSRVPWLFPLVAIMHYLVVIFYGIGFLYERLNLGRKNADSL